MKIEQIDDILDQMEYKRMMSDESIARYKGHRKHRRLLAECILQNPYDDGGDSASINS